MSCCTREVSVIRTVGRQSSGRSSWSGLLVLSMFVAVPAVLVVLAGYASARASHPTDDELTARFLSHEADFQLLAQSLDSDCRRVPSGASSCELADLVTAGVGVAGVDGYKLLLKRIGATSFRYLPRSGNLILPVCEPGENCSATRKSYLYLSHEQSQPLIRHQSGAWHGAGIYFVTGDHRIKGGWFIHHDGTVVVAFASY